MHKEEVIERIGEKNWERFYKFMRGKMVGINQDGSEDYYESDVFLFINQFFNELIHEREKERLQHDIDRWERYDFHQRGCYLEGLAGELSRGTVRKEFVVRVLEEIASRMK